MRFGRATLLAIGVTVASFTLMPQAASAAAPDPDAPPGAFRDWLPQEAWVMERWLPYDERRLLAIFGVSRSRLRAWLRDRRPLTRLARRRGVDTRGLAERLVAPREAGVPAATYRALVSRARRTLTQAHLVQHILFHDFHQWAPLRAAPRIFGVRDLDQWRRMRSRGMTPLQIGARFGRDEATIRPAIIAVLYASARRGMHRGATSRRQAAALFSVQSRGLTHWLTVALTPPAAAAAVDSAAPPPGLCHL